MFLGNCPFVFLFLVPILSLFCALAPTPSNSNSNSNSTSNVDFDFDFDFKLFDSSSGFNFSIFFNFTPPLLLLLSPPLTRVKRWQGRRWLCTTSKDEFNHLCTAVRRLAGSIMWSQGKPAVQVPQMQVVEKTAEIPQFLSVQGPPLTRAAHQKAVHANDEALGKRDAAAGPAVELWNPHHLCWCGTRVGHLPKRSGECPTRSRCGVHGARMRRRGTNAGDATVANRGENRARWSLASLPFHATGSLRSSVWPPCYGCHGDISDIFVFMFFDVCICVTCCFMALYGQCGVNRRRAALARLA